MAASDWTVTAIVVAGFLLFANTAADLSTSMFGRRVKSNAVRRLRAYDKQGVAGRSVAGATMGVALLIASQLAPVVALIEGMSRDQPLLLAAGSAEITVQSRLSSLSRAGRHPTPLGDQAADHAMHATSTCRA
jgi:hypothetical protein